MNTLNRRMFIGTLPGVAILAGCKSMTTQDWTTLAATLARNAVAVGVPIYLSTNPTAAPAFGAARYALASLLKAQDYDPAALHSVLRSLPIDILRGDQGALIVQGSVAVYEVLTATMFDVSSAPAVQAIMQAVYDGLTVALNAKTKKAKNAFLYEVKPIRRTRI